MKEEIKITKIAPVHEDLRGSISDLVNEKLNHVGLIVTKKDAVRGNHYHKKSKQYSFILTGTFEVLTATIDAPEGITRSLLRAGELITIPAMVIHQFRALEEAVMIDMISETRDSGAFEADVFRLDYRQGRFI